MSSALADVVSVSKVWVELAKPVEVLRAVLGPWRSYANALICRSQRRPSLQLIP